MTIASPMTFTFIQGHKCVSNSTTFNLQYLGQYLSYYIETWHDGRLMDAIYAHARLMTLTLMQRLERQKAALYALGN